ncbi:MAG: type I-C CRISPR-associated protein Cas8c/Csd1 [Armatimonadota bacterium]|nr:type I-C CRISPR-associated protein Cas8c/Csd1 [Armatimonadota bacterium]
MILQKLCEFAKRIPEIPPPMYGPREVKWQIELDEDGNYRGTTPLSSGADSRRGLTLIVPECKRTSAIRPLLIADKAEYVLGLGSESPAQSKHFASFRELVKQCADKTGHPAVQAVAKFLAAYAANPSTVPRGDIEKINKEDNVTFRVGDVRPIDLPEVRLFWTEQCCEENAPVMQCIVCGKVGPVDRVSPVAIKGIPGGQTSGTQIVSANKEAFESYGLSQALIAPTCRTCGIYYAQGVNYMLKNERHHVYVGPVVFVFWTSEDSGFSPAFLLDNPEPDDVRNLIESYESGREQQGLNPEQFYSLSLSGSGGRTVIRDWLDSTVPSVQASLSKWFALQRIVETDGSEPHSYLGIWRLAKALQPSQARGDQMAANVPRTLVRCALSGQPLPTWVLAQALQRSRSDQQITRPRAALIKAALLSQIQTFEEGFMERLEPNYKSPGYLCGRLLAELEAAQKLATNPKATLVDRYYGAASSAPATVFGYLLRDFQVAHMSKLRKTKPGAYVAIDNRVQEILKDLGDFPKTLNLKEQALFSLGYYHQKAQDRADARAIKELKELEESNAEEVEQ